MVLPAPPKNVANMVDLLEALFGPARYIGMQVKVEVEDDHTYVVEVIDVLKRRHILRFSDHNVELPWEFPGYSDADFSHVDEYVEFVDTQLRLLGVETELSENGGLLSLLPTTDSIAFRRIA